MSGFEGRTVPAAPAPRIVGGVGSVLRTARFWMTTVR
jgi:hypothetical protein